MRNLFRRTNQLSDRHRTLNVASHTTVQIYPDAPQKPRADAGSTERTSLDLQPTPKPKLLLVEIEQHPFLRTRENQHVVRSWIAERVPVSAEYFPCRPDSRGLIPRDDYGHT